MARVKKTDEQAVVESAASEEKKTNELTLSRMETTVEKRDPVVREEGSFVITTF